MSFKSFDPTQMSIPEIQGMLLTGIAPRPIALASTIDKNGNVNLAPFSFFNAFSANPPILCFSASRSGRTGETKDTYKNLKEVPEVCINIVEYSMVYQISFASSEFPRGVNEFTKSGLTEAPSEKIKPPRVLESPISYECVVKQVIELGDGKGSGNLFICQVVNIHVDEKVLSPDNRIDPLLVNQVSRCGGPYYGQVEANRLFPIAQPQANLGIGVDLLRDDIRHSKVLTGNNLGQLALNQTFPTDEEINEFKSTESFKYLNDFTGDERTMQFHKAAHEMLNNYNTRLAIICLYSY
jgi:flavin reductase (DIM6/NTAB) family NADH-FMN oxidoreductase RutF